MEIPAKSHSNSDGTGLVGGQKRSGRAVTFDRTPLNAAYSTHARPSEKSRRSVCLNASIDQKKGRKL
jgi:hypothetical protein